MTWTCDDKAPITVMAGTTHLGVVDGNDVARLWRRLDHIDNGGRKVTDVDSGEDVLSLANNWKLDGRLMPCRLYT